MNKCLIKDLKFFYDSWLIVGGGQLKMYDVINGHSISFDIKLWTIKLQNTDKVVDFKRGLLLLKQNHSKKTGDWKQFNCIH